VAATRGTVAASTFNSSPGAGRACDTSATLHLTGGAIRLPAMRYMCESCGFIYDPVEGDPDGGIPPGTEFEDIPDTWFCPVCGARKRDFTPYED
jgi:rubredoxin